MAKAAKPVPTTTHVLNRRRVLTGAAAVVAATGGAAAASVAPAQAPASAPLFMLTPAARELVALSDRADAALTAFHAIPGPKDRDRDTDARPEWIAARDRWHIADAETSLQGRARARAVTREVIREPLTQDSLVTLAAAAEWSNEARATLAIAVMHLAGIDRYPLDLFLAD